MRSRGLNSSAKGYLKGIQEAQAETGSYTGRWVRAHPKASPCSLLEPSSSPAPAPQPSTSHASFRPRLDRPRNVAALSFLGVLFFCTLCTLPLSLCCSLHSLPPRLLRFLPSLICPLLDAAKEPVLPVGPQALQHLSGDSSFTAHAEGALFLDGWEMNIV